MWLQIKCTLGHLFSLARGYLNTVGCIVEIVGHFSSNLCKWIWLRYGYYRNFRKLRTIFRRFHRKIGNKLCLLLYQLKKKKWFHVKKNLWIAVRKFWVVPSAAWFCLARNSSKNLKCKSINVSKHGKILSTISLFKDKYLYMPSTKIFCITCKTWQWFFSVKINS